MNFLRTAMLLAALTAIFMGVGFLIGGSGGMVDRLPDRRGDQPLRLLERRPAGAVDAARPRGRRAHRARNSTAIVRELAGKAGLPMPRVYVIDSPQPNAFATGRNPETRGGLRDDRASRSRSSRDEIAGVIAHELGHVRNRDTLTMTMTATIAGAISMLANFAFFFGGNRDNNNPLGFVGVLVAAIVAPIAALLVQMAVSRTREYSADRAGAEITGHPAWLISALAKIARAAPRDPERRPPSAIPATAHLFIVNPLSGAAHGQPLLDPPGDREPDRRAAKPWKPSSAMPATGRPPGPATIAVPRIGRSPGRARGPWG